MRRQHKNDAYQHKNRNFLERRHNTGIFRKLSYPYVGYTGYTINSYAQDQGTIDNKMKHEGKKINTLRVEKWCKNV